MNLIDCTDLNDMARPKRRLAPHELITVHRWLENRLSDNWVFNVPDSKAHPAYLKSDEMAEALRALDHRVAHAVDVDALDDDARAAAAAENLAKADAMTAFCEQWLRADDWTKLKAVLRQKKRQDTHGRTRQASLTPEALRCLQELVAYDESVNSQSDAIVTHLTPVIERFRDRASAAWQAAFAQHMAALPVLDAAAFVLYAAKHTMAGAITVPETMTTDTAIDALEFTYAHGIYDRDRFEHAWTEFEASPGKWRGLAKRKWPALKVTAPDGA